MTDVTWNPAGDDDTSFGPLTAHNVLGGRTAADAHPAAAVSYDNDVSGLTGDTVQEAIDELATHEGLTTTAHGGIVASTDPRLTDARTPTAHEASHHHDGSDPLSAADVGADPAGTAAALVATIPSFTPGRGIDLTTVSPGVIEIAFDNIQVDQYGPGTTTITRPSWARMAYVTCIGGGGGGGGGRRGATSTVRGGGGGGQGGGVASGWFRANSIATTVAVGTGGTAGAAGGADNTSGGNGGDGGATAVYMGVSLALLVAPGGQGGRGGTNTDGGQPGGVVPVFSTLYWTTRNTSVPGSKGGGATVALPMFAGRPMVNVADPNATTAWMTLDYWLRSSFDAGCGGGGGGGGFTAANANSDPSTGVLGAGPASHDYGVAGTSGTKPGGVPAARTITVTDYLLVGAGGGGGYQSSSGAAGAGGAGAGYGGAGGGGGGSLNGNAAGAGGAGAGGLLQIIWVA